MILNLYCPGIDVRKENGDVGVFNFIPSKTPCWEEAVEESGWSLCEESVLQRSEGVR